MNLKKLYTKNKKKILIFLIILIIVLLIFLFGSFLDYYSILEKQELVASVIIGDHYGIDANGSALKFGMIPPNGATTQRQIIIGNSYNHNIKVQVYSEGNISGLLEISENSFILEPNKSKEVYFSVSASNIEQGYYDGKVIILIRNPIMK